LSRFVLRLQKVKFHARKVNAIVFTVKAERLWRKCYPKLSAEVPGMLGAITARAEAQVLRLSLIYALLDCSDVIKTQHLRGALAVWRYCSHSARYIFGGSLGSRIADRILQALRRKRKGMSRTEIRELFQRNEDGNSIQRALDFLSQYRLATYSTKATDGRPREIWKAV
jgi:DNA replicative helicase MCM subunit Mcm2 (Cdc46/Mcm family)